MSPREDYMKGYKRAFNKAYEWLSTLDELYIGYTVNGSPYIDTKLLRKHFKEMMK